MIWLAALAFLALALLAWGVFEAGWLRCRVLDVEIDGLPEELDGLRIAHLSDFHLGVRSRGPCRDREGRRLGRGPPARPRLRHRRPRLEPERRAAPRAAARHARAPVRDSRQPRRRGDARSVLAAGRSRRSSATSRCCCGTRPSTSSRPAGGSRSSESIRRATRRGTARPWELVDRAADLRILLCHFPGIERALPPGAFHLVLAGHLHAGQIVVPHPGRARVARASRQPLRPRACTPTKGGVMHISPGTGTTFVPFRFFARPEVTELVLRPARAAGATIDVMEGHSRDLGGHPRELRRRCGARDRRRARRRRRIAAAPPRRQGRHRRRRRRRGRAPPRRRLGASTSPRSVPRCS